MVSACGYRERGNEQGMLRSELWILCCSKEKVTRNICMISTVNVILNISVIKNHWMAVYYLVFHIYGKETKQREDYNML